MVFHAAINYMRTSFCIQTEIYAYFLGIPSRPLYDQQYIYIYGLSLEITSSPALSTVCLSPPLHDWWFLQPHSFMAFQRWLRLAVASPVVSRNRNTPWKMAKNSSYLSSCCRLLQINSIRRLDPTFVRPSTFYVFFLFPFLPSSLSVLLHSLIHSFPGLRLLSFTTLIPVCACLNIHSERTAPRAS